MTSLIIPFPGELRPKLPTIVGNVDYLTLRQRLEEIDALLLASGAERDFVERALKDWLKAGRSVPSAREQEKFQLRARRALRCNVLRTLLQENYRGFSCQLAGNPLFQWFCLVDALDQIRVPSKSELQRFAHLLPPDSMRGIINAQRNKFDESANDFEQANRLSPQKLYGSVGLSMLYAPLARIVNISLEAALVSLVTFFFLTMMAEPLLLEYDR